MVSLPRDERCLDGPQSETLFLFGAIPGGVVLSINDTPGGRKVFGRFEVAPVETTYQVGGGQQAKRFAELIVRSA